MANKIVIAVFLGATISFIMFVIVSRHLHANGEEKQDIVQIEIIIRDEVKFNNMKGLTVFPFDNKILGTSLDNRKRFEEYLAKFTKTYSEETYVRKFTNFLISLNEIQKLNSSSNGTAVYGPTKFSDLSQEEFSAKLMKLDGDYWCTDSSKTCLTHMTKPSLHIYKDKELPLKFDWREWGVIYYVVDQLQCAGCWAIGTVETMESMAAIQRISYSLLSKQELIDCCEFIPNGCNGGNVYYALDDLCSLHLPITTEKSYPNTFEPQKCKVKPSTGIRLKEFHRKCNINENELLRVIATHGPVIALVNALTWKNYVGGVINMNCDNDPSSLNHAIQIVGYDLTGPEPYYIVKNSWGKDYGHDGYVYVAVGKNVCGIAREVFYIKVA